MSSDYASVSCESVRNRSLFLERMATDFLFLLAVYFCVAACSGTCAFTASIRFFISARASGGIGPPLKSTFSFSVILLPAVDGVQEAMVMQHSVSTVVLANSESFFIFVVTSVS